MSYEDIIDIYGNKVPYPVFVDRVGSKEAWKALQYQRKNRKEEREKESGKKQAEITPHESKPAYEIDGQFCPTTFNQLDNYEFRVRYRSKYLLYLYLRRFIVRKPHRSDKYDIHGRYYMDNKLACTLSVRRLAKDFGYKGNGQIEKWLKELFAEGAFEKDKIDVGKHKKQIVYILGEFRGGKPSYHVDNILN